MRPTLVMTKSQDQINYVNVTINETTNGEMSFVGSVDIAIAVIKLLYMCH